MGNSFLKGAVFTFSFFISIFVSADSVTEVNGFIKSAEILKENRVILSIKTEQGLGEVLFSSHQLAPDVSDWNNLTTISLEVRPSDIIYDQLKTLRARIFLEDGNSNRIYLPNKTITRSTADGWLKLKGEPTADFPIPLGFTDKNLNLKKIKKIGLNFETSNNPPAIQGTIEIKGISIVKRLPPMKRPLPIDPRILAEETARAKKMNERIQERFGKIPGFFTGVNLAWPSYRNSAGTLFQLYSNYLHTDFSWNGEYLDLRHQGVLQSVRQDFQRIHEVFGDKAVVRVFLFTVLSQGMEFDSKGMPVKFTDVSKDSIKKLFQLAQEENLLVMPVLFDFLLADGQGYEASDPWRNGERPDLFTHPEKRAKLFQLVEDLVHSFANHPAVLVWDLINEPENAVAVASIDHFQDLQIFLKEGVDAIHRAGELATVGHRNLHEVASYFRGKIATDFGQAHFYPYMESRPNPVNLGTMPMKAFGPLPSGWGESPVEPHQVLSHWLKAKKAGHKYFMFWSWRGDDESGDGFKVRAYADEIIDARIRLNPQSRH